MANIPYPQQYDDSFMNIFKRIIDELNSMGYTYEESLQKAQDILEEARQTNDMNKSVQQQINTLIAESGTSDAEVLQARTDAQGYVHAVLKERLDQHERRLGDTARVINVLNHGAVGDGVTDDYVAIQGAITLAETLSRQVYIPGGDYYVSKTLRTAHKTTASWTGGIRIYGDGKETKIIGNGADVVDYSDLENADDGAIFALHGGNNILENMTFSSAKVGLFMGQHPETTVRSSVGFNTIENIWAERVGTGILLVHSSGNHYNKFKKIHVLGCQIGIHLGKGIHLNQFNNNRNTFEDIRVSYGWIGYLVEEADGSIFKSIYAEGLVDTGDVVGPKPAQLPDELGGKKTGIVALDGQYNFFDGVGVENCQWHVYSVGYQNVYDNMMVHDSSPSNSKVMFPNAARQPRKFEANTLINPVYTYQPTAGVHFDGSNGAGLKSRLFDIDFHWQSIDLNPLISQVNIAGGVSRIRRLARMFTLMTNIRFSLSSGVGSNDPIKINLPFSGETSLDSAYGNETGGVTLGFAATAGYNATMEVVRGRFSSLAETQSNNDVPYIVIDAPSMGWSTSNAYNNISFQVDYYSD